MQQTFKNIASLLAKDVDRVVPYLHNLAKIDGDYWETGNKEGDSGKSLKINRYNNAGNWRDYATGDWGDLIDLWMYRKCVTKVDALNEAKAWLGIRDNVPKFNKLTSKPNDPSDVKEKFNIPDQKFPNRNNQRVLDYLIRERLLKNETLEAFKIGACINTKDGKDIIVFPYISDGQIFFNKVLFLERPNGKKEEYVYPKNALHLLFGWNCVSLNATSVAIFEGEIDAMTAYQYKPKRFNPETKRDEDIGMLSLPFGGGTGGKHKWIEHEFDRLSKYDEIFICMDPDKEGQLALQELINRLGKHKCSVVKIPYKDANECLQKDVSSEQFQECFRKAEMAGRPKELVSISHFKDVTIDRMLGKNAQESTVDVQGKSSFGYTMPFEKTWNNVLFRPGDLSVWTGTNGHGKSLLLGYLMLHCIKQGAKVCMASLEMKPTDLSERLIRQFTTLEKPSKDYMEFFYDWANHSLFLYNHVGTVNGDKLLSDFKYANQRYGVDVFLIDSLMKCGLAEDDWNAQKIFLDKICDLKNELNCHIHLIAHPRKGEKNSDCKDKLDVKGSGAITDLANNVFSVYRNVNKQNEIESIKSCILQLSNGFSGKEGADKDHIKEIDKHKKQLEKVINLSDGHIECSKQRNGEWDGKIYIWFDPASFQYLEGYSQKVQRLVDFSITQSLTFHNEDRSVGVVS